MPADGADDSLGTVPADTGSMPLSDPGCGLTSDLAGLDFLEGDAIRFEVSCSGELATADALVYAVSLPNGASFDWETRVFDWQTGPADGGRVDIVFSVERQGVPEVRGSETVTFWVADDPTRSDNVPVNPATYTEEWGLPVVHLETDAVLDTEEYADATVTWYGRSHPAGIQVHGRTSSHYPKVSYGLKFSEEPLPVASWGETRDHLLLITTFDDNSYVRQKFVYDLWAQIADFWGQPRLTPRTFFTVVYMNGSYLGLYLGADRIDDEFVDQMGFDRDANLYKAVDDSANYSLVDADGVEKTTLHQGYEKMEGDPEDDFADLDALVQFTGTSSSAELIAGSGGWLDLNEWMDAYLMLFYTNGEDSYLKNSYLCHEAGGVFRYVPWDFNASWGQNWQTYRVEASFEDADGQDNRVFWALQDDRDARAWMWGRFDQMRELGPFAISSQEALLDGYFSQIDRSAQRDWEVWEASYQSYDWAEHREEHGDWTDYEGEKAYLYQWVVDRAAHFESAYP